MIGFCLKMHWVTYYAVINIFLGTVFFGGIETKLIYYPMERKLVNVWVDTNRHINDTYFFSRDGIKLNAWYVRAKANKPTIIYCHGQGENISMWQNVIKTLTDKGYGVFMLEYRGHGRSQGAPSESGLYIDLESSIKYLETFEKLQPKNIVLWGRSLGGAVVADVASRHAVKAVILESTFTNIRDEALYLCKSGILESKLGIWKGMSGFFVRTMPMSQKFSTDTKIQKIHEPLLMGHSEHDTTVPVEMSKKLAQINKSAILHISNSGSHHESDWFFPAVLEFLDNLN